VKDGGALRSNETGKSSVRICVMLGIGLCADWERDSSFSNVEQNHFKKIYRAKTPRRKEKISFCLSELGMLCVFARVIFF
jgi:hypothetical protein